VPPGQEAEVGHKLLAAVGLPLFLHRSPLKRCTLRCSRIRLQQQRSLPCFRMRWHCSQALLKRPHTRPLLLLNCCAQLLRHSLLRGYRHSPRLALMVGRRGAAAGGCTASIDPSGCQVAAQLFRCTVREEQRAAVEVSVCCVSRRSLCKCYVPASLWCASKLFFWVNDVGEVDVCMRACMCDLCVRLCVRVCM